jgi:hypothetical protein
VGCDTCDRGTKSRAGAWSVEPGRRRLEGVREEEGEKNVGYLMRCKCVVCIVLHGQPAQEPWLVDHPMKSASSRGLTLRLYARKVQRRPT